MVCAIKTADSDRVCGPECRKQKAHFRFIFQLHHLPGCDFEGLRLWAWSHWGRVCQFFANFTRAMLPDIKRSVDWVFIHCDLITRAAKDVPPDVLYSLSTSNRQISYPFKEEPYRLEQASAEQISDWYYKGLGHRRVKTEINSGKGASEEVVGKRSDENGQILRKRHPKTTPSRALTNQL